MDYGGAPTLSSGVLRSFEPHQFPADGQRTVASDNYASAPSQSAMQHDGGNSNNQLYAHRALDQTNDSIQAPTVEAFVHGGNSEIGIGVQNSHEQAPTLSNVRPGERSQAGASIANPMVIPEVGMSMNARTFNHYNPTAYYNGGGQEATQGPSFSGMTPQNLSDNGAYR